VKLASEPTERRLFISSIKLNRFLSFSDDAKAVDLRPLNLIIGPNGCGKSNFLEAFALLRRIASEDDLRLPADWIYKSDQGFDSADIQVEIRQPTGRTLCHAITIGHYQADAWGPPQERIGLLAADRSCSGELYRFPATAGSGGAEVQDWGKSRQLSSAEQRADESILHQLRDPERFPEITFLADTYQDIRLFRDWRFGRTAPLRQAQSANKQNRFLEEDGSNLGLILNRFQRQPDVKDRFLEALRKLYPGIADYVVYVQPGSVEVELREGRRMIPATLLSDGTVRYLCLLAILLDPTPPPVVCIEEPELGMHPDILPTIAELLLDASERCQLIVTTHSEILVDAMHHEPEHVLVASRGDDGTQLDRLDAGLLQAWLREYRLGELWMDGTLGGTRW
jgi:predicted ATPase